MIKKFQFWLKNEYSDFQKIPLKFKLLCFSLIIFGTVPRFFGLFNLGYVYDMVETQFAWGKFAFDAGYFGFWRNYPMNLLYDYPPISLLYEYILVMLTAPFGYNINLFVALIKSVNWVFEIAISLLILFLVNLKKGEENDLVSDTRVASIHKTNVLLTPQQASEYSTTNNNWKFFLSSLVYALPALWFVSGTWGQNDSLMALLAFLSVFVIFKQAPGFETTFELAKNTENKVKVVFYKDINFWAGILFATAIQIKQQPILALPFILFFYLFGKTWKDIFKASLYALPFGFLAVFGSLIYSENKQILFQNASNWDVIVIISLIILIIPLFLLTMNLNVSGSWYKFRRWLFGVFLLTNVIFIPLLIVNYVRLAKVTFATVGRIDVVGNGGATFLSLLSKNNLGSEVVFKAYNFSLSIGQLGLLIYLSLMTYLFIKFFGLTLAKLKTLNLKNIFPKSFSILDFTLLFWVHSSAYFLFFTKMHSRYLHMGVIFAFFVLAFQLPKWFKQAWLKLSVAFSVFYFLNQIGVFAANNKEPYWANQLSDSFQVNPWTISSIGLTVCFSVMYYLVLRYFVEVKER